MLRIVKLVPKARSLRRVFMTLLLSLPAIGNVGIVLLAIMFMYVSTARTACTAAGTAMCVGTASAADTVVAARDCPVRSGAQLTQPAPRARSGARVRPGADCL